MDIDIDKVIKVLESIAKIAGAVDAVNESTKDKYGIIRKRAPIKYLGKEGYLVWDHLLLNELTFEDSETGKQYSLGLSPFAEKIEEIFDEMVKRYGIEAK